MSPVLVGAPMVGVFNPSLWSFRTEAPIYGSPAVATVNGQDRVYVGSTDGYLYCVQASDGSLIWKKNLGNSIFSSPVVIEESGTSIVLCGSHDGRLYALSAVDGTDFWTDPFPTGNYIFASPAFDPQTGYVFIPSYDGILYAINAADGKEVWRQFVGPTRATPAVYDGIVYTAHTSSFLNAFEVETGHPRGSISLGLGIASSPAVVDFNGEPLVIGASLQSRILRAVRHVNNKTSFLELWQKTFDEGIYSSPAVANGIVYVGTNDSNLYALDLSTGDVLQTITFGKTVQVSPAIVGNTLLAAAGGGELRAFGNEVTAYRWVGPMEVTVGVPTDYLLEAVDARGGVVETYRRSATVESIEGGTIVTDPSSPALIDGGRLPIRITFNEPGATSVLAQEILDPSIQGLLRVDVVPQDFGLNVQLQADKPQIKEDETVTYIVAVRNIGARPAPSIVAETELPTTARFEFADPVPNTVTPTQVTWNLGDIPSGASRTVTIALQAEKSVIFKSNFSLGELSDAWETSDPRLYFVDQNQLLVSGPKIGFLQDWLHTKGSILSERVVVEGTAIFDARSQSMIGLSRNGTAPSDLFLQIQTDIGGETVDIRHFGVPVVSAPMPGAGRFKYRFDVDFEAQTLDVKFFNVSDLVNPILEYSASGSSAVPATDSLFFGVFNNNGALLFDDNILITNPDRVLADGSQVSGADKIISSFRVFSATEPILDQTSTPVTVTIKGNPEFTASQSVSPVLNAPRLALQAGDPITFTLNFSNTGDAEATAVRIWDTVSAALDILSVDPPPSSEVLLPGLLPAPQFSPKLLTWEFGNLPPGGRKTVTVTTRVKNLISIAERELFLEDFTYDTNEKLVQQIDGEGGRWTTATPEKFTLDGASHVVATAANFESDLLSISQPVLFGDDVVRVTVKLRFNTLGASQFLFRAGQNPFLLALQTDSNNLFVVHFDDSLGDQVAGPLAQFEAGVDYYLEMVFNRVAREAVLRLIDSRTGFDVFTPFLATNLGTFPEINFGFRAFNNSISVDSVRITSEDLDQTFAMRADEFNRKFTTIPHFFAWIEKPAPVVSLTGPLQVTAGEEFEYLITVQNHGSVPATGVHVEYPLPPGVTFVNSNPPPTFQTDNIINWDFSVLNPFTQQPITVRVQAGNTAATVSSHVNVNVLERPVNTLSNIWKTQIIPAPGILSPQNGELVNGSVEIAGYYEEPVVIQWAPAESDAWTDIPSATGAPYVMAAWDTSSLSPGSYMLRVVDTSDGYEEERIIVQVGEPVYERTLAAPTPNALRSLSSNAEGLYAVDRENHKILVFNEASSLIASIGSYGSRLGELYLPQGAALSDDGTLYVADTGNGRIQAFRSDSTVFTFGEGRLREPRAVEIGNGKLYVLDGVKLHRFDLTGTYLSTSLLHGVGPYSDIAADMQGRVYLTNTGEGRLEVYSFEGAYLYSFTGSGKTVGGVTRSTWAPGAVSFHDGHLFVTDLANHRVQKFGAYGNHLMSFGGYGIAHGQLDSPEGVIEENGGVIYVADTGNGRIEKFRNPQAAEPSTPRPTPVLPPHGTLQITGLSAVPEVFDPALTGTRVRYTLSRDAEVRLSIASPSGNFVFDQTFPLGAVGARTGFNEIPWSPGAAAQGDFTLTVQAQADGETVLAQAKVRLIRGEPTPAPLTSTPTPTPSAPTSTPTRTPTPEPKLEILDVRVEPHRLPQGSRGTGQHVKFRLTASAQLTVRVIQRSSGALLKEISAQGQTGNNLIFIGPYHQGLQAGIYDVVVTAVLQQNSAIGQSSFTIKEDRHGGGEE